MLRTNDGRGNGATCFRAAEAGYPVGPYEVSLITLQEAGSLILGLQLTQLNTQVL
jgi:hypothetical protein